MKKIANAEIPDSRRNWLYKACGMTALLLGALFLAAILSLITGYFRPDSMSNWLFPYEDNWLVVLFKLNAGVKGVEFERLYGLNALDLAIMALTGMTYLGLGIVLRRESKIWSIIAAVLPFLGIALFIATKLAGRSGVMGAGLILSVLMLRSNLFSKMTAYMGILACVFLLAGDFGTSANSQSDIIAILIGIGYLVLMAWFFLLGRRLFQLV